MATINLDMLLRMRAETAQIRMAEREIAKLRGAVTTLNMILGAVGLPALALTSILQARDAIVRLMDDAEKLNTTAQTIGLNVEMLQRLRYAAEMSGVATGQLDVAMQRFIRRVAEARAGGGELRKTLAEYGIQLNDSNGKARDSVDILGDYAEAIRNASNDQERLRLAFKGFDSEGAKLVGMLKNGREGLSEFLDESNELVPVLDQHMVDALVRAGDAFKAFGISAKVALQGVVAEAWMVIETLNTANSQQKDQQQWRERAAVVLYERETGRTPEQDKLTPKGALLSLPKSISMTEIDAVAEQLRRKALQEDIKAAKEKADALREAAQIQREEAAQRRLTAALGKAEAELAKLEADAAYEALSTEEKRKFLKEQMVTLEAELVRLSEDGSAEGEKALLATTEKLIEARKRLRGLSIEESKAAEKSVADKRQALELIVQGVRFERELLEARARAGTISLDERRKLAVLIETERKLLRDLIKAYRDLADAAPNEADRQRFTNRARELEVALETTGQGTDSGDSKFVSAAKGPGRLKDPTQHFQTMGEGALGAAGEYIEDAGTAADRLHESLLNIADTLEGSITDGLYGLITGTMTWNDALRHVGVTILSTILQSLIQMAVQWMIQQALMAVFGQSLQAASLATTTLMSQAALMAWTPAAVAASIATFGGALANGPAAMAMIQGSRMAAFEKGGLVTGDEQIIRVNEKGPEFVMNARATAMNLPVLEAMNAGVPISTIAALRGGVAPTQPQPQGNNRQDGRTAAKREKPPLQVLVYSREEAYRVVKGHPDYEADITDVVYRRRGKMI